MIVKLNKRIKNKEKKLINENRNYNGNDDGDEKKQTENKIKT